MIFPALESPCKRNDTANSWPVQRGRTSIHKPSNSKPTCKKAHQARTSFSSSTSSRNTRWRNKNLVQVKTNGVAALIKDCTMICASSTSELSICPLMPHLSAFEQACALHWFANHPVPERQFPLRDHVVIIASLCEVPPLVPSPQLIHSGNI